MIGLLHLNYWCETEEQKQELRNIFYENEKKHQEKLRERYNPDKIFERKEENLEEKHMVEYKESFYIKIINFIKKLFKKKN